MEIMNAIAQIAQMVGVPCVCLGAVMWYVNAHFGLDIKARLRYPTNRGGEQRENNYSNSNSV